MSHTRAYPCLCRTTSQLWEALSEKSGQDVAAVMRHYVRAPGFPYLTLSASGPSGGVGGALHAHSLHLGAGRFMAPWALNATAWPGADDFPTGPSPAAAAAAAAAASPSGDAPPAAEWSVPVTAVTGGGGDARGVASVLQHRLGVLALANGTPALEAMAEAAGAAAAAPHAHWIKLNSGNTTFMRVIYDSTLLARLLPAVRTPANRAAPPLLSVGDRLGLVSDAAAAAAAGMTPVSDLLTLLWALRYDQDYNVWAAVLDAASSVHSIAEAVSPAYGAAVLRFIRALVSPAVAMVGWAAVPGEDSNMPLLRALVLRWAALSGDTSVVADCLDRFNAYVNGGAVIPADLRGFVYNTAAAEGGEAAWDALEKLLLAASMSEEQRRLMTALGRATSPALLTRALGLVLSETVRSQDSVWVVSAVASNPGPVGRELAWAWLKANWEHPTIVKLRGECGGFVPL